MSRIGRQPIPITKDVNVGLDGDLITIKGPKGELKRKINTLVNIKTEDDQIVVLVKEESRAARSCHGLFRALIANMVIGVTQGFVRNLEIVGVGYRAELSGRTVTFHLGYSHPITFELPAGIDADIERTRISLRGIDKDLLGRTAAKIRGFRKPEPYKGKGIKYVEENIRRKAGKTGAKA